VVPAAAGAVEDLGAAGGALAVGSVAEVILAVAGPEVVGNGPMIVANHKAQAIAACILILLVSTRTKKWLRH
jgi:hypothetical protein